jgi:ABC-type bacteriocin/lantibiotic exporter with double-glycine peptidase domain
MSTTGCHAVRVVKQHRDRAIRDAPILLLDEATSAWTRNRAVQDAVARLAQGRTTIIAHRLATVKRWTGSSSCRTGASARAEAPHELVAGGGGCTPGWRVTVTEQAGGG